MARPIAWLPLDAGDSDPMRFLAYLVAALQTISAGIGAGVLAALESPQPPVTESGDTFNLSRAERTRPLGCARDPSSDCARDGSGRRVGCQIVNRRERLVHAKIPHNQERQNESNSKDCGHTGVLFILATLAGPLLATPLTPDLTGADYLAGVSAQMNQAAGGVLLWIIAAYASAGIAIAMYPVLKERNVGVALGSVVFRALEAAF